MTCRSLQCPCNRPDADDGTNPFLMLLADAQYAIDTNQHRLFQVLAESGGQRGWWRHASRGLHKALKDHPADFVPPYMR